MTIQEAVREAKRCLAEHHVPDAETDTMLLLQSVCGIDRSHYYACMDEELKGADRFLEKVRLRASRVPLQQIIQKQVFCALPFLVTEDVLCPRQETEVLVLEAVKRLKNQDCFLDLCTGSGCIAVALLKLGEEKNLKGCACDLSDKALKIAEKNAAFHGVTQSLELRQGDLFEAVSGRYDMIVSNPPYIASDEIASLMEEVRDHEPRMALDGGRDGLAFYRRILQGAGDFLKKDGWLLVEIGFDQGEAVRSMFEDHRYKSIRVIKDLAGLDRVVLGQRGD